VAKAGVNANSIPDIHQSLIDDGLVDKAKIGGANYFWSFKAKKDRMAQIEYEKTLKRIEELKPQVTEAANKLVDAKRGREDDDDEGRDEQETAASGGIETKEDVGTEQNEVDVGGSTIARGNSTFRGGDGTRAKKLARLSELAKKKVALEQELELLKENDPAALADLQKELKLVTQAAHRWTDNIFECKNYLVKKRGMEKKDAMKFLNIGPNFDCQFPIVKALLLVVKSSLPFVSFRFLFL
jgi:Leucine zipper with capping helix domain/Mnd1 HTH domain